MEIHITQELLDEINTLVNDGDLVNFLQDNKKASIEATIIILQSVIKTVDYFQEKIDEASEEK